MVGERQSFLAPWAALLVVHATVYRTFSQGARQVGAAVVGVLLAWSAGNLIGPDVAALAAVVFLGLLLGRSRWLEGEATTAAATSLIVLTTGFSNDQHLLVDRLLDTGIGIAVGLIVNVTVWPPLRRRSAIAALDALDDHIGELLVEVADGLAGQCSLDEVADWLETTRDLDEEIDRAWALVRQARESAVLNPRRSARQVRHPEVWIVLLRHMEQAVAETRSIARTLERFLEQQREWDPDFRDGYIDAVRRGGRAIESADADEIRDCPVPSSTSSWPGWARGSGRRSCGRCTAASWSISSTSSRRWRRWLLRIRSASPRCRSSCVAVVLQVDRAVDPGRRDLHADLLVEAERAGAGVRRQLGPRAPCSAATANESTSRAWARPRPRWSLRVASRAM